MSLSIMGFHGQPNLTEREKRQLEHAIKNIPIELPPKRCMKCGQREVKCECSDGFNASGKGIS